MDNARVAKDSASYLESAAGVDADGGSYRGRFGPT